MEVTGHKAHGAVPEPGSVVIARVRFWSHIFLLFCFWLMLMLYLVMIFISAPRELVCFNQ